MILYDERRIKRRVAALARRIDEDFAGRTVHLVGVLTGAFVFTADLCRALTVPCIISFIRVRSYRATKPGPLALGPMEDMDIEAHHVILVEDVVDTGRTLSALVARLAALSPASLSTCVLLDKTGGREVPDLRLDYVGFTLEGGFVVGYGLDADGLYRNERGLRTL